MKGQPIAVENPRPNLVERMHRSLGDIIRTENFENPIREVDVLLSSCTWEISSTTSVVTGKPPGQLIHNKSMMA